jgi:hypothetical protein
MVMDCINFSGGSIVTSWLSFFPQSALGGLERISGPVLAFLGMWWMVKSYFYKSACHQAVLRLRCLGALQYWRFTWSVRIIKGSFVHSR